MNESHKVRQEVFRRAGSRQTFETRRPAWWSVAVALLTLAGCAGGSANTRVSAADSEAASGARQCRAAHIGVQVLGSGGPILDDDGRASSGYVVWVDGRARILVDLGPGTMLRFGESGGAIEDLDAILLTHMHIDHVADLPAFAKTAWFGSRRRELPVFGPAEGGMFPSVGQSLERTFGAEGLYPYMGGYLEGRPFLLSAREVAGDVEPVEVMQADDLLVQAVGVPHGPVPALGFAVMVGETKVVFTGDQRGDEDRFAAMAAGAELLVAHMAVSGVPDRIAGRLHATPAQIGALASEAEVTRVLLSHLMPRSLASLAENVAAVEAAGDVPVVVAQDGMCLVVD